MTKIAQRPVMDLGAPGCFDDNGMILGDIIKVGADLYMYYVGFQLVQKVKFFAFTGLAISSDNGVTFKRVSEVPILERADTAKYIRAVHTVIYENSIFKTWYAVGNRWQFINGKAYPAYNIWYTESKDGINFSKKDSILCIDVRNTEYRIGRPKVYKTHKGYQMFYTKDTISKDYSAGFAESEDGINWRRKDNEFILKKSESGWDSQMACYPVLLEHKGRTYMFYNGNNMGYEGFGYAELEQG